jgi:hypothetical protein
MMAQTCEGITASARQCQKAANRFYLDSDDQVIRAYCAQHSNGHGPNRMLRPYMWEYSRIVDVNGHTLARMPRFGPIVGR